MKRLSSILDDISEPLPPGVWSSSLVLFARTLALLLVLLVVSGCCGLVLGLAGFVVVGVVDKAGWAPWAMVPVGVVYAFAMCLFLAVVGRDGR